MTVTQPADGSTVTSMWALSRLVHTVAIHVILLCDVAFVSRIYRVIDTPVAQPLLLGILAAIAIFYTVLAGLERRYTEILIQALFVALVTVEMLHFSELTAAPVNINAAFQYVLVANFVAFATFIKNGLGHTVVLYLFRYSFAYTVVYAVFALLYQFNAIPREMVAALLATDPERGDRLFIYPVAAGFAWFSFLTRTPRRLRITGIIGTLVCGLAIWLSLSRVYILCIVLVSGLWLARFRLSTMRAICLGVLWTSTLTYSYGILEPSWNPFTLFSSDTSGSVRADEYNTARLFIQSDPFLGAGLASAQGDVETLTGNYFFYAGDLGVFGVWFDLGVVGLIMFLVGSHINCLVIPELDTRFRYAVFLTGSMLTAYSCISPEILNSSGGTFFALLLAYWFQGQRYVDQYLIASGKTS